MRKLSIFGLMMACLLASVYCQSPPKCQQEILSLVMIVDASGSVGPADFDLAKQATIDIIDKMNINPNKVHVGYIVYDNKAKPISSLLSTEQNKLTIVNKIRNINYWDFSGGTNTAQAIDISREMFSFISRPNVPKIAVIFTDGYSNSESATKIAADKLKNDGVIVFSVGITSYINDEELQYIASTPKSEYYMKIANYNQLMIEVNRITERICGVPLFVNIGKAVTIDDSPQNQQRNFQTDLTNLKQAAPPRASLLFIDLTVYEGSVDLTYSLSSATRDGIKKKIKPTQTRINPNNSRTLTYWIFPSPNDKQLNYNVKSTGAGNNKYDVLVRTP